MPPPINPSQACVVQCTDLTKRFGSKTVIDRLQWSLAAGQINGLVGDSASGKTTLLRLIAGLAKPNSGSISFGWPEIAGRREARISLLFQNLALWPHLTARRQVEWVIADRPRCERRLRAEELLAEMRLPPPAWDRLPRQLSGGEGQRVALARALAASPDLLLLDEPLAHLDTSLRADMLSLLARVGRKRPMTTVYVTHVWSEVVRLCSRVAVLHEGRIVQQGEPEAIYWQPANAAVARLTGAIIEVPRSWLSDGSLEVVGPADDTIGLVPNHDGGVLVRPRQLRLKRPSADPNWQVIERRPLDESWLVVLASGGRRLELSTSDLYEPGERVSLELTLSPCKVEQTA
jgi:ABC-type Fe3+/spermidine/putrescine transport system ATPase subunit